MKTPTKALIATLALLALVVAGCWNPTPPTPAPAPTASIVATPTPTATAIGPQPWPVYPTSLPTPNPLVNP
jgi:hypothetical protein